MQAVVGSYCRVVRIDAVRLVALSVLRGRGHAGPRCHVPHGGSRLSSRDAIPIRKQVSSDRVVGKGAGGNEKKRREEEFAKVSHRDGLYRSTGDGNLEDGGSSCSTSVQQDQPQLWGYSRFLCLVFPPVAPELLLMLISREETALMAQPYPLSHEHYSTRSIHH
jgi:hypothetical protein